MNEDPLELPPPPASLNRAAAVRALADPELDALSALVAVSAFAQDDMLDGDGQPLDEGELLEILQAEQVIPARDNLARVCGLLHAAAGDEFFTRVTDFRRMVGAINDGDPFQFEEEDEEPSLPDVYWALYLVNLVMEDDALQELSAAVSAYIVKLAEDEVEDMPAALEEAMADGTDPAELQSHMEGLLVFRRQKLVTTLLELGCERDWLVEIDPLLGDQI